MCRFLINFYRNLLHTNHIKIIDFNGKIIEIVIFFGVQATWSPMAKNLSFWRLRGGSGEAQGGSREAPGRLRGGSGEAPGGSGRVREALGKLQEAPGEGPGEGESLADRGFQAP